MKKLIVTFLALFAMAIPWQASAQTNVKKAFDKFLNSSDVEFTEQHSLDRDSKTGKKTSQLDLYKFTISAEKEKLVKDVFAALRDDRENAYTMESGLVDSDDQIGSLAIGDGTKSVRYTLPKYNYMYCLFLAPSDEDPDGIYRYAYGIYWKKDKNEIKGSLFITYATTLKYRQEKAKSHSDQALQSMVKSQGSQDNSDVWFQQFMNYVYAFDEADDDVELLLATRIYQCAKQMPENVSEEDRRLANNILSDMIESKKYSANTLKLLNAANEIIK